MLTFALQRKLPYKKMLIVTGVLLGLVLVVMVGQTARTMQGTGWLPITPLDWEIPSSFGLWLGIFPSVETIVAQIAAIVFVIGSYASPPSSRSGARAGAPHGARSTRSPPARRPSTRSPQIRGV